MKKIFMVLLIVLGVCALTNSNRQETHPYECDYCHREVDTINTIKIDDGIVISKSGEYWCYDWHFDHICDNCMN